MKTLEYTFLAGETKTFPGGNFFMLLDTTSPVDILFSHSNRPLSNESAEGVEAGFRTSPLIVEGRAFDSAKVTSALAQTVKVAISAGYGGYDRVFGSVDINNSPSILDIINPIDVQGIADPVTVLGIVNPIDVQGIADPVTVLDIANPIDVQGIADPLTPHSLSGTGYWRLSASAALNTIVTPAANINGVKITAYSLYSYNAHVRLIAKTAAPATWDDGIGLFYHYTDTAAAARVKNGTNLPIIIPPGFGLYEMADTAGSVSGCGIAHEVL